MSSNEPKIQRIQTWLVIALSVLTIAIYAKSQFLYSLYFLYQIGRFFFPSIVPDVDRP